MTSTSGSLGWRTPIWRAKESFGVPNINKSGSMDYETALRWVAAMNAYDQGRGYLGHNNWTLPTNPSYDGRCRSYNVNGLQVTSDGRAVYDPVADVTWSADVDLAMTETFGVADINPDGSMGYEAASKWVGAMNKARWLGQTSWKLPSSARCGGFYCKASVLGALFYERLELREGAPVVAIPDTPLGNFHNIQPYLYWSCAGETVQGPCQGAPASRFGWSFSFGNGFQGTDLQPNNLYVMVYFPDSAR